MNRAMDVETIQDWKPISCHGKYTVAKHYITTAMSVLSSDRLILLTSRYFSLNFENEEVKQENSNKNPTVNSVQRGL